MNPLSVVYLIFVIGVGAMALGFYSTIADLNKQAVSCVELADSPGQDKCLEDVGRRAQALSSVVKAITKGGE